jgi:hypothetical protein
MSDNLEPTTEEIRERFIPISRQEIVDDLIAAPHWQAEDKKKFEQFCQIFEALYHYKFHANLEELKHSYAPFNPDTDNISQHDYSDEEKQELNDALVKELRQLLNNANYEELTVDSINEAINAESYYGVSVEVDLDDFEEMIAYYRGSSTMTDYKRTWYTLFIKKKAIEVPIYQRLFILLKFKPEEDRVKELVEKHGEDFEKKARKQVRYSRQALPADLTEGHIFIKLFKNLPRTDLEMLYPNQNVRLKMFDKIKLGITGGGGFLAGLFSVFTKMAIAVTNPITFIAAFFGLIGVIVRQVMNIFNQRTKYMMTLSKNLYFHNLDNNMGVMNYLIDMAEEEEGKEFVLAYYFLHTQPEKNYTQESLDREIEAYIKDKYGCNIDFEVEDGLRKLRQEGILIEQDGGILKVLNLQEANKCLDNQWDNFFNPE